MVPDMKAGSMHLAVSSKVFVFTILILEVEQDGYCQTVIRSRIQDGLAAPGPVYEDIREFVPQGAEIDCDGFVGGFPCQDTGCSSCLMMMFYNVSL